MNLDFSITLNNSTVGSLPSVYIKSFSFVEDIYKMYTGAKVILKDTLYSLRSQLYLGQDVTITFKEGSREYVNSMKILSIDPLSEGEVLTNELAITLVSSWYFYEASSTSKAFTGNVGNILEQIYEDNLKDLGLKSGLSVTQDVSRIRYQVRERLQDFMKKIRRFGIVSSLPVYLYMDKDNTLNLKGLSTFATSPVSYSLIPDAVYKQWNKDAENSVTWDPSFIRMNTYSTALALQRTNSRETSYFSTKNFVTSNKVVSSSTMHNVESSNSKILESSPKREICWNWNYLPQDALALSVNDYFDRNLEAFSFQGSITGFNLNKINLGNKVKVYLPSESSNINDSLTSSTTPEYIITRVERVYRGELPICSFKASLANYGSSTTLKPSDVSNSINSSNLVF